MSILKRAFIYGFGNILIWYNYTLFMPFFLILSSEFFPQSSTFVNMISGFCVFGFGLFARPIGAYIFGKIGDACSREKSVGYSWMLLSISTMSIGLIPSYSSIGILSTILLLLCRIGQGIAMGGATGISLIQLVELVPNKMKSIGGCIGTSANFIGLFTSTMIFTAMNLYENFGDFIWRIPFIFGGSLIPFAVFQLKSDSTPATECNTTKTLLEIVKSYPLQIACVVLVICYSSTCYYSIFAFLPNYAMAHFPEISAHSAVSITNLILTVGIFLCGYLSDKIGNSKTMITGFFIAIASVIVISMFLNPEESIVPLIIILGANMSFHYGAYSAYFTELFPKNIRCVAITVPMSISQAIFGGITPVLSTALIKYSFNLLMIPMIIGASLSILVIFVLKRKND